MPTIAILGRTNVGKSTLFNRLAGSELALSNRAPSLTRDWRDTLISYGDVSLRLVDTAGLEEEESGSLGARMTERSRAALEAADMCLFVVDARAGLLPQDKYWALVMRKAGKRVCLVANKCDGRAAEAGLLEAHALGFGAPLAVSAKHALGMDALVEELARVARKQPKPKKAQAEDDDSTRALRLAIVGRPNAGKSSLVNRLLKTDRMLTGPEPGITRESVSTLWRFGDVEIALYDTAGLRRPARIAKGVETLSVGATLRAIRFADVVVLVMDACYPFEKQDLRIGDLIAREGRAPIIALNKIDIATDMPKRAELEARIAHLLPQLKGVDMRPLSALTGAGVKALMPACLRVHKRWRTQIGTGPLNRWLARAETAHQPPSTRGRKAKLKYITQTATTPPSFVIFTNRPRGLPVSYRRYLVNDLRKTFDMPGIPIRLSAKQSENPYRS